MIDAHRPPLPGPATAASGEADERLRLAVRAAKVGLWDWDLHTNQVYFSPEWKQQIGWAEHELAGSFAEWQDRLHPEDAARVLLTLREHVARPGPAGYAAEFRFRHKDGSYRWILAQGALLLDASGQPVRMLGAHLDITGRKQAEAALRESEAGLQLAQAHARLGSWELEVGAARGNWSREMFHLFGLAPDSVAPTVEEFLELVHPEDRAALASTSARLARTSELIHHQFRSNPTRGHVRTFHTALRCLSDDAGRPVKLVGAVLDVTDQQRTEAALRESERKFSTLFRNNPAAIALTTPEEGRILEVNESYCRLLGYPQAELVGRTVAELQLNADADERARKVAVLRREGRLHNVETTYRHRSGRLLRVLIASELVEVGGQQVILGISQDITERVQAEQAVRQRQQQLDALISNLPGFVYRCRNDRDWTLEFASQGILDVTGHAPEEFVRGEVSFGSLIHPDDAGRVWKAVQQGLREHRRYQLDYRVRRRDGTEVWVWEQGAGVHDADGRLLALEGIVTDNTERHRAEAARLRSEAMLQQAQAVAQIGSWQLEGAGNILTWSDETHHMFGLPVGTPLSYERFLACVHPDDRAGVDAAWRAALQGAPYEIEHRIVAGESVKWVREQARLEFDAAGRLLGGVGTVQDITHRKQAEEELSSSELRFRSVWEHAVEGMRLLDAAGLIVAVNEAYCRLVGLPRHELEGRPFTTTYAGPRPAQELQARYCERFARRTIPEREERRVTFRDHRVADLEVSSSFLEIPGRPPLLLSLFRDVTERILAKAELRASEELFRSFFEASPDAIVVASRAGIIQAVNRQVETLFDYAREELLGQPIEILVPRQWPASHHAALREQYAHNPHLRPMGEGRSLSARRKNGGEFPVDICLSPINTARGMMVISTIRDLTSQKQLEEQLRQAQKMDAIGQLAGGIAHDFNNLIGAILGNAQLAMVLPEHDPGRKESLESILSASQRAADLVRQILAFSRREESRREPVQLHLVVREALKLLRATVPASITFETDLAVVPAVLANASQIHQVTMNLCTNAWHAMRDHPGRLRVTLDETTVDEAFARLNPDLRAGRHVRFTVADTGCGMDAATVRRIFEPFFTTKPPGEGTGLGLSVVHGIIKSHDGGIVVRSERGQGTTFQLFFPVYAAPPGAPPPRTESEPLGRGEQILLVDDEVELASLGKKVLERLGYQVTALASPDEALAEMQRRGGKFDLAILDLNMPGMNGVALAGLLHASQPGLPMILATGYSATLTAEQAQAMGFGELLSKPYELERLGAAVRRALDGVRAKAA